MKDCRRIERLLPGFAGGELAARDLKDVTRHVQECTACASEVATYRLVIGTARDAWREDSRLPAAVVTRMAHRGVEEARRMPWWRRPVFIQPSVGLAAGVSMAALLLVLALPMMRNRTVEPASAGPVRLDMQVEDGVVHLAWSDGRGRPYKVYKATDPRLLGQGEAAVVRGNRWVDQHPDSAQIVFYRVE